MGLATWEKEIIQKIELKKAEIYNLEEEIMRKKSEIYNLERESSQRKAKELELRKEIEQRKYIQGKLQEIREWIPGEEYILSEKINLIDDFLVFKTENGLIKYNDKDGHHKNIDQLNKLLDIGVRFKFRLNECKDKFGKKFCEFAGNQL